VPLKLIQLLPLEIEQIISGALNQSEFSSMIARTDKRPVTAEINNGAVAQLGERMNGIHEVRGSIPLGSTKLIPQNFLQT
jgi:hypothetical protein